MKRKTFIKSTAPVIMMPFLRDCLKFPFFQSKAGSPADDRVLVLVQMQGGNDGLNTIVPLDQYSQLTDARKNILIPEKQILPLKDSVITGFHPAMKELQGLYNNRKLAVIQGVILIPIYLTSGLLTYG